MLDNKDLSILTEFNKQKNEKITVAKICKKLNLSRGNFYFHINHLEKEFKNKKNEKFINDLKINLSEFCQQIENIKKYFFSQKQRFLIIGLLLTYTKTLKLNEIKIFFGISTNTAFLDVKNLEKFLLKHQHLQELKIINKKDGYFLVGSELIKRKLLINLAIEVVNLPGYELLKTKVLEIFENQKNKMYYLAIEKNFEKNLKKINFVDFESKTFTLIYFILALKYSTPDFKINEIILNNDLKFQKSYQVAQEILKEMQILTKNSNFGSEFELTILGLMLSSHTKKFYCQNLAQDLPIIKKELQKVLKLFQGDGYSFNKELNHELIKYLHWIKHININDFTYDYSDAIRKTFILKKKRYANLYFLVEKYFKKNFTVLNAELCPRQLMEITLKIIKHVQVWPNNQNEKVILISDLKGGWINLYTASINENWNNYKIVKILNWKFYLENKQQFKSFKKISDNEKITFENNGIHIPNLIFED